MLAILNGMIIGISRTINSQLAINIGPFGASFYNHFVGFIFISILLILTTETGSNTLNQVPWITLLGGVFGAFFVAVNSYVFPRLGAIKTVLLVISGQMITGLILDYKENNILSLLPQLIGLAFILTGVYLAKTPSLPRTKVMENAEHA